jgi:hypothetical protein
MSFTNKMIAYVYCFRLLKFITIGQNAELFWQNILFFNVLEHIEVDCALQLVYIIVLGELFNCFIVQLVLVFL